jgi:hypothetical protein
MHRAPEVLAKYQPPILPYFSTQFRCVCPADTPSLKSFLVEAIQKAYPDARKLAIKEGKLAKFGVCVPEESEYPITCPFSIEQILDEDFYGL